MYAFLASSLIGVAVAGVCWLALGRILNMRLEKTDTGVQLPLMFRVFMPLTGSLRKTVQGPGFAGYLNQADLKIVQAGLDQRLEPEQFVAIRMLYAGTFSIVGLFLMALGSGLPLFMGISTMLFGVIFPNLWLTNQVRGRHRAIQRALPSILDLLTLSVEAGRDFLTSLKDILRHRKKDPIGEELERVFREIQLGKQRRDALRAMSERVRQPDLTSAVDAMVQADELGISLGSILRILGDQMRAKRFHYAEKLANEAPTKLLLPLILFIFPAVIIIMLGPVLMQSLQQFY